MHLGLQVSDFTWPDAHAGIGPTFARIAQDAEANGFTSLWVMDHSFQIEMIGPPQHEMLEAHSALAFAAVTTNHISLGTLSRSVCSERVTHPNESALEAATESEIAQGAYTSFSRGDVPSAAGAVADDIQCAPTANAIAPD